MNEGRWDYILLLLLSKEVAEVCKLAEASPGMYISARK